MTKHILDNIPIYRAKKIDSDEWVVGYYTDVVENLYHGAMSGHYILNTDDGFTKTFTIDPTTLAIHSPRMMAHDSDRFLPNGEKDLRIFASLDEENGVGGDELNIHLFTMELGENMGATEGEKEFNATAIFNEYGLGVLNGDKKEFLVCYAGLHEESIKIISAT